MKINIQEYYVSYYTATDRNSCSYEIDGILVESAGSKKTADNPEISDSPQFAAMQQILREGDIIYIYKLAGTGRPAVRPFLETSSGNDLRF